MFNIANICFNFYFQLFKNSLSLPKTKRIMLPTQEDIKTEFKQSFTDDVIIALVAFANAKGGKVYVGMRDNGTVCGVSLGKEALQTWLNEIKQKTEPSIIPDLEVIDVQGKTVVMLTVQEYPVKPVSTKGRYYVRQANSNHLMSAFEISNSILQTKNSSWDYYPCIGKTLSDIDIEKVKKVMRVIAKRNDRFNITDPMEFLRKYELIDDQNHISNGCYLMFCKDINILTTIQMGHFASEIVIKDDYIVDSDIIEQVDEVMQFIRKHINKALIIVDTQTQNIQRWDYPLDALREIVLNMIVHRDYRAKSESTIKIFSDHILFYNPGQLPDGITIEQLRHNNYVSKPYNKQVAKIFKEMGEIERFGTGVKRVCDMFIDYGLPKPEWILTADGWVVKVFATPSTEKSTEKNTGKSTENDTENVTEKPTEGTAKDDTDNVTEKISTEKSTEKNTEKIGKSTEKNTEKDAESLLLYIKKNPFITITELCKIMGLSDKGVRNKLEKLKQQGLITRIGPDKGGYWKTNQYDDVDTMIMSSMKQNPSITIAELCNVTRLSDKSVRKNIDKLKQQGLIVRVGPDKGGHWEVSGQVNN